MIKPCPVCDGTRTARFQAVVLNKYEVSYLECGQCGLLQTEEPYWLEEAYSHAIADTDTGVVARNIAIARQLACLLFFAFPRGALFLDVGGGYGLLTRLMRDIGFDFRWSDPFCENLLARGFERESAAGPFAAVTAFEVLEHVYDPLDFVRQALADSGARTLVFTTELFAGPPPAPEDWWYYSLQTGQHVSLYQRRTLARMAERLGLSLQSHRNFHALTDRKMTAAAFRRLTGGPSRLLYEYVKRRMSSKTWDDRQTLMPSS